MPPTAASTGTAARRGDERDPPGSIASHTSFVARAKKNTIATSLTGKCTTAVTRE